MTVPRSGTCNAFRSQDTGGHGDSEHNHSQLQNIAVCDDDPAGTAEGLFCPSRWAIPNPMPPNSKPAADQPRIT